MSTSGVMVDPKKVKVVLSCERPNSVFEIRNFFVVEGYYQRFIEHFSWLAAPIIRLTRKKVQFHWDDSLKRAFHELKRRLTLAPILIVPERGQRYIVYRDTS